MTPNDRKYSKEHEWIQSEDGSPATMGITDFAQEQLGDVVYLDLPQMGARLEQAGKLGEVESVKAVSDIYSPVSGEVVEINEALSENPELVNEDPYDGGWLVRILVQDPTELELLLTADQYEAFLKESSH